ncbi:helix-turn-helix domain-containing protein [Lacticaseibacillus paracasei]
MGVIVGTYSNWEYGNRFPAQENIKKILRHMVFLLLC